MNRMRALDISESYYLLLELICTEPIIQQAFSIIDSVCLSHGVAVTGDRKPTPGFQQHLDAHWMPFLRASVRAMHAYGFVPWRLMTLASGDKVPEVLPAGTFRWTVEVSKENDAMLSYVVRLNPGARPEPNIHITPFVQPNFLVTEHSTMYATVLSPLSSVIESFKNLQAAIKRQAHADAWNCTARIVVAHEPKEFAHDQQRRELFNTLSFQLPEAKPAQQDKVADNFAERSMNHTPAVYSLPPHHHVEATPALAPCMDIAFLHTKYRLDVCALVGVPSEMLPDHTRPDQRRISHNSSRTFQAKMQVVCCFLRTLLAEVHLTIYGKTAEFELIPMPRLEITSIDDLKTLHEIGVLRPEHAVELASILMGTRKRKQSI